MQHHFISLKNFHNLQYFYGYEMTFILYIHDRKIRKSVKKNYTEFEKTVLKHSMLEEKITVSRKTDSGTNALKIKAWERIQHCFNATKHCCQISFITFKYDYLFSCLPFFLNHGWWISSITFSRSLCRSGGLWGLQLVKLLNCNL